MITSTSIVPSENLTEATAGSAPSAVAWPAIWVGAVVAVAVMLTLLVIGSGAGLASVSAWAHVGLSAVTATVAGAIWLLVVQWIGAGIGGYLTGRLRTKWAGTSHHEIFFRDTAHGFVAWALSTVIVATVLISMVGTGLGAGVRAAAMVGLAATPRTGPSASSVGIYDVDRLFRTDKADAGSSTDARAESLRILTEALRARALPADDRVYLAQLVVEHAGISTDEAQKRVDDTFARLQASELKSTEAAEAARKAAAEAALLAGLALLIGAFIACAAAALGGHEREQHR